MTSTSRGEIKMSRLVSEQIDVFLRLTWLAVASVNTCSLRTLTRYFTSHCKLTSVIAAGSLTLKTIEPNLTRLVDCSVRLPGLVLYPLIEIPLSSSVDESI